MFIGKFLKAIGVILGIVSLFVVVDTVIFATMEKVSVNAEVSNVKVKERYDEDYGTTGNHIKRTYYYDITYEYKGEEYRQSVSIERQRPDNTVQIMFSRSNPDRYWLVKGMDNEEYIAMRVGIILGLVLFAGLMTYLGEKLRK